MGHLFLKLKTVSSEALLNVNSSKFQYMLLKTPEYTSTLHHSTSSNHQPKPMATAGNLDAPLMLYFLSQLTLLRLNPSEVFD